MVKQADRKVMTVQELNFFYDTKVYIRSLEGITEDLKRFISDPGIIEDLSGKIRKIINRRKAEQKNTAVFLQRLEDPEIKQIIFYRYEKRLEWSEVNLKVYDGITCDDYPRIRLYRYLEKT